MSEVCRICTGSNEVHIDEDIPLCAAHWDEWLSRYVNADSYPPCAAHLIRTAENKPLEQQVNDRIEAASMASAKDEDASNWHDEPEHYRNGWYTRMAPGIAAADAHDQASGIHRITLDDATVERAAEEVLEHWHRSRSGKCSCGEYVSADPQARARHLARAVLAEAVKEEQA